MTGFLFNNHGVRKYLVDSERRAFIAAAVRCNDLTAAFCLALAFTGARISETLALTSGKIDVENGAVVFETLKQRKRRVYRAVPVPTPLLQRLSDLGQTSDRLWPWGRTTAWKQVKAVMGEAGIVGSVQVPKSLRHGFAIHACQRGVPLNIVQRWMGHARLETTAIYAAALGEEERKLAKRCWENDEMLI